MIFVLFVLFCLRFIQITLPSKQEKRSLDLEASRGGAGAPVRNEQGRAITRFPVTMERDDYGSRGRVKKKERNKTKKLPYFLVDTSFK